MGSQVVATRISDEMAESIARIAKERHRKTGAVVREAIEFYLEHCSEYRVAMERMQDPTDPIVSEADLIKELGWDD